jgi:hypothetical protein
MEARLAIYFGHRFIQCSRERRAIIAHRRPHDVEIYIEIRMNKAVPHGNDFSEKELREISRG